VWLTLPGIQQKLVLGGYQIFAISSQQNLHEPPHLLVKGHKLMLGLHVFSDLLIVISNVLYYQYQ